MKREISSDKFPMGTQLPQFSLKGVRGSSFDSGSTPIDKGLLIVFTCNHCPYVKGSEAELMQVARRYGTEGLKTVTINSNDPIKYPEDNFEKMEERAKNLGLPYPYLFDATQEVARLFDAACTPESYLFDKNRTLVYHGAINDNPKDSGAAKQFHLRQAVEQLLSGKAVNPAFVHPFGCSIKWRT